MNNLSAASHLATVKNVFSLDPSFSNLLLDGLSHFMLIVVDKGTINMAVTSINGKLHRLQTGTFGSLMGEEKEQTSFQPPAYLSCNAIESLSMHKVHAGLHPV